MEIGEQVVFLRLHDKTQTPKYNSAFNLSSLESAEKGPAHCCRFLVTIKRIYDSEIIQCLLGVRSGPGRLAAAGGHWAKTSLMKNFILRP